MTEKKSGAKEFTFTRNTPVVDYGSSFVLEIPEGPVVMWDFHNARKHVWDVDPQKGQSVDVFVNSHEHIDHLERFRRYKVGDKIEKEPVNYGNVQTIIGLQTLALVEHRLNSPVTLFDQNNNQKISDHLEDIESVFETVNLMKPYSPFSINGDIVVTPLPVSHSSFQTFTFDIEIPKTGSNIVLVSDIGRGHLTNRAINWMRKKYSGRTKPDLLVLDGHGLGQLEEQFLSYNQQLEHLKIALSSARLERVPLAIYLRPGDLHPLAYWINQGVFENGDTELHFTPKLKKLLTSQIIKDSWEDYFGFSYPQNLEFKTAPDQDPANLRNSTEKKAIVMVYDENMPYSYPFRFRTSHLFNSSRGNLRVPKNFVTNIRNAGISGHAPVSLVEELVRATNHPTITYGHFPVRDRLRYRKFMDADFVMGRHGSKISFGT